MPSVWIELDSAAAQIEVDMVTTCISQHHQLVPLWLLTSLLNVVNADNPKMKPGLRCPAARGGAGLRVLHAGSCQWGWVLQLAVHGIVYSHQKFAFNLPTSVDGLCRVRQTERLCLQLLMIRWKNLHHFNIYLLKRLVAAVKLGACCFECSRLQKPGGIFT